MPTLAPLARRHRSTLTSEPAHERASARRAVPESSAIPRYLRTQSEVEDAEASTVDEEPSIAEVENQSRSPLDDTPVNEPATQKHAAHLEDEPESTEQPVDRREADQQADAEPEVEGADTTEEAAGAETEQTEDEEEAEGGGEEPAAESSEDEHAAVGDAALTTETPEPEIPIPPPPELGGIIPKVIPLPPVMSRDQRLDILARTGMRPEAHHSLVRQRLDTVAERARRLQDDIVREARLAAMEAVAAFMTKADSVPGMMADAEEQVRGAYGAARARVHDSAGEALDGLEAYQGESLTNLDASSLSMQAQLERVLAASSPAIQQLHQQQLARVEEALEEYAGKFHDELDPKEQAIRNSEARHVSTGTPSAQDSARAALPPEIPWGEILPARQEAEERAWPMRAGQKADDVKMSIEQNAAMILGQRETFGIAILQLVNPAAVQLETVAQHEEGQVGEAGEHTRLRVATDYERAVNTVTQFRDRALQQLDAGEQGAVKEIRAVGRRLEKDIRTRAVNLDVSIGETARDLADAYRTQMAGVNESLDVGGFLDAKQTEPFLSGAELRLTEMYAQQSASLSETVDDAVASIDEAIDAQMRGVLELVDNSQTEAGKIAREQVGAITNATAAFGRALNAPTDRTTGAASPYTATASETLGRRPEQVGTAVAEMIDTTRTHLQETLDAEKLRVQRLVDDLENSLRSSIIADGLAKISDLNDRVRRAYNAMVGVGTEEGPLMAALRNLTAIQGKAMEAIWKNRIPPTRIPPSGEEVLSTLREWLDDELSGDEWDAAFAYLDGNTAAGARFELEASMRWYGDDEGRIEEVLRDLQQEPPPGGHIQALKDTPGWEGTNRRLQSNLDGTDLDVTNALLAGNRYRADALRLRERIEEARRAGDADKVHKLLEAVPVQELARVRREFAAAERGLGPDVSPDITDEDAQATFIEFVVRDRQVIDHNSARMGGPVLKTESLTEPNRNLAIALASRRVNERGEEDVESQVNVRAARMEAEVSRRGDKNLENLQRGFEYDQSAEINDDLTSTNPNVRARAEQRRTEARQVRMEAMRRFAARHGGLEGASDEQVRNYTAGVVGNLFDSSEGRLFGSSMVQQGFADPAAAMRLAVEGRGTDEDLIKRTLSRLDRDQIAQLRETYRTRYHEDLDQRLGTNQPRRDEAALAVFAVSPVLGAAMMAMPGGELSGDDRLEVELLLRGRPRNDRERYELELARTEQQRTETGVAGRAVMAGSVDETLMNEGNRRMIDIVDRAGGVERAFDEHGRFIGSAPTTDEHGVKQPNQEEGWAFGEELKWNQFGAEAYKAGIDRVTNFLSTALAVIAAVVVSILIPGVGGAIAGALIGGLLGMATKAAMKGGRYGWEEAAVDLAVTAVDALTAGLTHGLGEALRGAGAAVKGVASRGAAVATTRAGLFAGLATRGRKAVTYIATEGLENFVGSVPSSFTGQLLNEQNWKGGSPFTNILKGTLIESGISAGVGLGMSAGMAGGSKLFGAVRGSFRERAMRNSLMSSIPHEMRPSFADIPVLEVPARQFDQMTGSRTGQAVTIITPDGPVIYVREGASPRVLREEGIHLMQTHEAQWQRHAADLSEANLGRWHEMSLSEQLTLYRKKLDLEIDAQERLLLDLGDELALAGPLHQRSLRRQIREVETALDNLQRRRVDVDQFTPERIGRVDGGAETRPDYLDDPPRLFNKKSKESKRGRKADDETRRTELPTDKNHPDYSPLSGRKDITGTVVEIGPRWVEPSGREYRLVGVVNEKGQLTHVRQEIRSAREGDIWVQRGSDSAKRGELAESASRRMSAADVDPDWPTTRSMKSQWDESGRGFDEVLFDFRIEGGELVGRVRVIEVKDYPGRYVPLDSFTAVRVEGNLDANLRFVDAQLRTVGTLPPPRGLGLTEAQVRAARTAIKKGHVELEIRKTADTDIGEHDAGTVLESLRKDWEAQGLSSTPPRVRDIPQPQIDAAKAMEKAARGAKGSRAALRERALRLEFERSIPPSRRSGLSNVEIIEIPTRKFREKTGSESGDAVTVITEDGPVVWIRQGADPRVLREEGVHALQARERAWAKRIEDLSESNLARWHEMPIAEQLSLYRTKLEVEIDAQQRLLRDLSSEVEVATGSTKRALEKQMREAQETLANLSKRLDEVNGLSKSSIRRMAAGKETRPTYLDQPPRLFSKRSTKGPEIPRGVDGGDEVPGARLDRLIKEQQALEQSIATSRSRQTAAEAAGLSERARRIEDGRIEMQSRFNELAREVPAEIERLLPQLARVMDLDLPDLIAAVRASEKAGRRLDAQQVINSLRNQYRHRRPPRFGPLEGAISQDALQANVIALQYMREKISEFAPDAVLAVERGGGLLAEALQHGQAHFPPVHTVPKHVTVGPDGEPITQRIPHLEERIRHLIEFKQQSHFAIVDVYMGGHFAAELRDMIERIARDHPHAKFDVLWLRETTGHEALIDLSGKVSDTFAGAHRERGMAFVGSARLENGTLKFTRQSDGVVVPVPTDIPGARQTEIPVHIVVGDDMTTTVFDPDSRGPLRIFDRKGRIVQEIKVPTVDPVTGEPLNTVRAVLIRLLNGVKFPNDPII